MSAEILRKHARSIFDSALTAADPGVCIRDTVTLDDNILKVNSREYDLSRFRNIYVVAFGKAAPAMAEATENLLGELITEGIVVSNTPSGNRFRRLSYFRSSHPVPDEKSVLAAEKILEMLSKTGESDLVIFLISGGGSSLLTMPREGLTLEDKRKVTEKLLLSGVDTHGLNAVRKKLSQIKGGGLLKKAFPSQVITLILSDVVGDRIDAIASGPTVPDTTTYKEAWRVIEALEIEHQIPPKVVVQLEKGKRGEIPPLITESEIDPGKVQTVIAGNNFKSLLAAQSRANELDYNTLLLSSQINGEAREVAKVIAGIAFDIERFDIPVNKPCCIIFGGETTVNVTGTGLGGRNTETALAFCMEIIGHKNIAGLFAGTDGIDGPTDAAGAVCDGNSRLIARTFNYSARDHLMNNDSYSFFDSLGDLIRTGPTGTNVMDIGIVLIENP